MSEQRYLETFFREKDITYKMYEVEDDGPMGNHLIDSEMVIDLILHAPEGEQATVAHTLRQIDFRNGDVHHYLEFLAGCFVKQQRAQAGSLQ